MTTIARKVMNQKTDAHAEWAYGAVERDQLYDTEETAYIFEDGSALVFNTLSEVRIVTKYGRSVDHEQL